ncbi:uncharacterized protein M6B38_148975 [Iris pallida]|uniref:DNL-type domain-containing protein n=1 Tax=Iris pallida TaxID=29817 RepID=A0AAX6F730_IRIPA|nr:uncharacterized protein M6B38_148975 [Iris pallida]
MAATWGGVWSPQIPHLRLRPPLTGQVRRTNSGTAYSGGPPLRAKPLRIGGKPRVFSCSLCSGNLEEESFGINRDASKEAFFDIKLPRRNLIVQFTCNACSERTQRTVNRLAYERGTVFVQCASCLVNHKLVDNLGLVVEYDLRKEKDPDSDDTKLA